MEVPERSEVSFSQLLFTSQDCEVNCVKIMEQLASLPSCDGNPTSLLNSQETGYPDKWKGELVLLKQESRKWRQEVYSTFTQFKAQQPVKTPVKPSSKQARITSLTELFTKVNKDYDCLVRSIAQSELRIQEKEQTNSELKRTLEKLQSKLHRLKSESQDSVGCAATCQLF
jgi:chromosome segregation ATPase